MNEQDKRLVRDAYNHALPDPYDEREVLHAPLLRDLAQAIERLSAELEARNATIQSCDELIRLSRDERDRLREELAALKAQLRNPDWVCLEGMSASELAAYDYGSTSMMSALRRVLDGEDTGQGVSNEPWETLKRRLLALKAQGEPVGVVTVNVHGTPSVQGLVGLPHGTKLYLHPPVSIPEGWQLVPKEPTSEMIANAVRGDFSLTDEYRAMLAAAPRPPVVSEDVMYALRKAKEKLEIYRANSSGEYQGGMEYTALMYLIDKAMEGK